MLRLKIKTLFSFNRHKTNRAMEGIIRYILPNPVGLLL